MTVECAAEMIPVTVVGWDIAISHDGAVLIEGNGYYDVRMSEMAYSGYWRNPVFRRLIFDRGSCEMSRIGRRFDEGCAGRARGMTEGRM